MESEPGRPARRLVFRGDKKRWIRYLAIYAGAKPSNNSYVGCYNWPAPEWRVCPVVLAACEACQILMRDYYGIFTRRISEFGIYRPAGTWVCRDMADARLVRLINIGLYRWAAALMDHTPDDTDLNAIGFDCLTNLPEFRTLSDVYVFAERINRSQEWRVFEYDEFYSQLPLFGEELLRVLEYRPYEIATRVFHWLIELAAYECSASCAYKQQMIEFRATALGEWLLPVVDELIAMSPVSEVAALGPFGGEQAFAARLEEYWYG